MKGMVLLSALVVIAASAAFAAEPGMKETGVAQVKGTAEGSPITGTATFQDVKGGLKVTVSLSGVPGDTHALHIHEFGDCGDMAKASGGHFNPEHHHHGNALKDARHAHAGDLGNVTVKDGNVVLEAILPEASLTGKHGVAGRAIVLHEKADDFSQPVGNAGGRIACGVITIVGAK